MNKKITIFCIVLLMSITSCKSTNVKSDKLYDMSGIWLMKDTEKMMKFLNLKNSSKGYYCVEWDTKFNKWKIRFMYDKNLYEVDVRKIDKSVYRIEKNDKYRDFEIIFHNTDLSRNTYSLHFKDSKPFDINNPGEFDGIKQDVNQTLDNFIKMLEEDYEFAQQEGETPLVR